MRKIRLSQILPEDIPGAATGQKGRIEFLGIYRRLELVRRESA